VYNCIGALYILVYDDDDDGDDTKDYIWPAKLRWPYIIFDDTVGPRVKTSRWWKIW